jgi:hypothetical protein
MFTYLSRFSEFRLVICVAFALYYCAVDSSVT